MAWQNNGIFLGLERAKGKKLFSPLKGSAHTKHWADMHHPADLVRAGAATLIANKLIRFHQIAIWLSDFNWPASVTESTVWLLSRWKGSQPNTTFTRPQILVPDFNIHYYIDQTNHRSYLSFYCSLTHFTQSCSEQNHRWTSEHTESTTTTLDMKRKFY